MTRHERKIKKQRGSRYVGRGNKKHGRGKGSRMGRGSVKSYGGGYRNIMHIFKYEPERLHRVKKRGFVPLNKKAESISLKEAQKIKQENNEIDVTKHGYSKVIGTGKITQALKIKAHKFTEGAKQKIEKAGGQAIVINQNPEEK